MVKLKENELLDIVGGGGVSLSFGLIFGGIVVVIAGIIDGYLRPLKCTE